MILHRVLFGLLISAMVLASIGVPIFVIQLILCIVLLLLTTKSNIDNKRKELLLLITLLVCIDKTNDLLADFDLLRNLGPIIYCFLLSRYLLTKNYNKVNGEIPFIFWTSILAVALEIAVNYTAGVEYRLYSGDISTLLLFIWILNMWYGTMKIAFTCLIVFLTVFTFEARTMILSISVFTIIYLLWNKIVLNCRLNLPRWYLRCVMLGSLLVTFYGIWDETIKDGMGNGSGVFSGHGVLWGLCFEQYITGDIINQVFGFPTTSAIYERVFGNINLLYNGNEYIANNSENSLLHGNFHSSLVYYLYNTGILGLIILYNLILKAFKNNEYNFQSIGLFSAVVIVSIFNGQSLTSIYLISTLFILSLFYRFPPIGSVKLNL